MRSFSIILPQLWTGSSGRQLRGFPHAQTAAAYVMTGPHSNLMGLYYLPLGAVLDELGMSLELWKDARDRVTAAGIAEFDLEESLVWVPEHLHYQLLGNELSARDGRRAVILREYRQYKKHKFARLFEERYGQGYGLTIGEPSKSAIRSPLALPKHTETNISNPNREPYCTVVKGTVDQDQGEGVESVGPPTGADTVDPLQVRAEFWRRHAGEAALRYPQPERWSETQGLFIALAQAFGHSHVEQPLNSAHPGVQAALHRWADGITQADLLEAIVGAGRDEHKRRNPQYQTLQTILRDEGQVRRFQLLARAPVKTQGQPNHGYSAAQQYGKKR